LSSKSKILINFDLLMEAPDERKIIDAK